MIFDLFIRCPFAKLIGKHSRYWWHVSASSSSFSSTFSGRRFSLYSRRFTFVNGPLVCEDFMPVWLGFLFFFGGFWFYFCSVRSCRASSKSPLLSLDRRMDGHHPGQPIPLLILWWLPIQWIIHRSSAQPQQPAPYDFSSLLFFLGNEMKEKRFRPATAPMDMMKCVATTIWPKKELKKKVERNWIWFLGLGKKEFEYISRDKRESRKRRRRRKKER